MIPSGPAVATSQTALPSPGVPLHYGLARTNTDHAKGRERMNANTLASAVAAARNASLPPALPTQPLRAAPPATAPSGRPAPAAPVLSDADALMIAIQRSAGTVDDIMTRRMLLAAGGWEQAGGK